MENKNETVDYQSVITNAITYGMLYTATVAVADTRSINETERSNILVSSINRNLSASK